MHRDVSESAGLIRWTLGGWEKKTRAHETHTFVGGDAGAAHDNALKGFGRVKEFVVEV